MEVRGDLLPEAVCAYLRAQLKTTSDFDLARRIGVSRTACLRAAAEAHVLPRTRDAVLTYFRRADQAEHA